MKRAIRNIFFIEDRFIESYSLRIMSLLLFDFILAFTLAMNGKYALFLNIIYYVFATNILYAGLLFLFNIKQIRFKENKVSFVVLFFILIYCVANSFLYSENSIEGGHDQGTYLESAVLLAKTGSFSINSNDKPFVYTFPAWLYYPNGTTRNQFLPGNAIFLSIFYKLFGFIGIEFFNSFLLFFSASILYQIIRKIFNIKTTLFWLVLFLFNFYTIIFTRANYVENIQLFFTWFYIYLFLRGFIEKNFNFIAFAFIPLMLLMTIRFEGFLYIPMYILGTASLLKLKKVIVERKYYFFYILSFLIGVSIPFFIFVFDKTLLLTSLNLLSSNNVGASIANGSINKVPYNQQFFIWVNTVYMFTPIFITFVILGILNIFNCDKKVKTFLLLITVLILPQFLFFIRPGIAFYLPWFMRRFWAVFMPFGLLFVSSFFFENTSLSVGKIKLTAVFFVFLILTSSGLSIFFIKQGSGIMNYEKRLASVFSKDDLVIFWDKYLYENYGPPLFFFYDTNVVYNRPPAFSKVAYARIMKPYRHVYLATFSSKALLNHPYFQNNVNYLRTLESSPFLTINASCDTRQYIQMPSLFKSYDQVINLCSINNPPSQVNSSIISLNIYKIDDNFKTNFVKENYDPNYKIINQLLK